MLSADIEIFVTFYSCLAFTVLFLAFGREGNTRITLGGITSMLWIAFSLLYVASEPSFPAIAWLFFAIGLIVAIAVVHDSLEETKRLKEAG